MLVGDGYTLVVLTNTSAVRMTNSTTLTLRTPFKEATLRSFDGLGTLSVTDNTIKVDGITDGAIIILK